MDIQAFFKWCSIINIALFILSVAMVLLIPDFIYSVHGQLFGVPREDFNTTLYAFLGLYKILIIVFNLVPYLALRIIGTKPKT